MFKSKAQRRKFYAMKAEGKMDQRTIDEWEASTPSSIPERVKSSSSKVAKLVGKRVSRSDFQGFPISIERAKGSIRKGTGPNGPWETKMQADYGYIRGTVGTDGDHVDVYIGDDPEAENVYVVNQMKTPEYTDFDEQKMMLGYPDIAAAKKAYLAHYDNPKFLGSIKAMDLETFREKVMDKESKGQKVAALTSMDAAKRAKSGEPGDAADGAEGSAPPSTMAASAGNTGSFGAQLNRMMVSARRRNNSSYAPSKFDTNPIGTDTAESIG